MKDKKFEVVAEVKVHLTCEDVDAIMCSALDAIGYWCRRAQVAGEYLGEYASEQISRGGTLTLYDAESSDKWTLDLEKFLNGVKLYFEQGCHVQVEDNSIDAGDIDANDADCIVQFALFEKVVFG